MGGFKDKATEQSYYQKNKERIKAKSRARVIPDDERLEKNKKARERWRATSPEHKKDRTLRAFYGITLEEYNVMLAKQNGVCAICSCNRPKGCGMKGGNLYVDHDHATNKVRGLLCTTCNTHLATFESHKAEMEAYLYSPG